MGNHELNAILFHRRGTDGRPLRLHDGKNKRQHRSFLEQFGTGTPDALGWTDWFLTLPLWLDLGGLRLVHACWDQHAIDIIRLRRPDGRLQVEDLPEVAEKSTPFARAVETLTSGTEIALPPGYEFRDSKKNKRHHVRIAWWRAGHGTWREAALSVPDPTGLPEGLVDRVEGLPVYPEGSPPVLVGHYKMQGHLRIEAPHACCLDYPKNPCVYHWSGERELQLANLQPCQL
jgi:hypothetical protein